MKKLNIPIVKFRDQLNEISPSFCAAKWQQVTMHLQTGHTHSCHHPRTHKVPLNELIYNPSALHNTNYKKLQRKDMLEGKRPEECDYCWRVEDNPEGDGISDRIYKSSDSWAIEHIPQIISEPWDQDVVPSYLEVSFSSVCNFKCSYCTPQVSSKWMEEIEKYGPYPTSSSFGDLSWLRQNDAMPIPHKDENLYVDAFWKWWPEIYTKLEHFRITGGEPLLTKDLFKVLDYVIEHPNPDLHLSINSNMCPPPELFNKFIEKIKIICGENKVKQFKIFTSAEAHGKQAEYIRYGLNYNQWLANIRRVLDEVPNCTFTVMSTYNLLSIFTFEDLMKDILQIKVDYSNSNTVHSPIILDVPYLRFPHHQTIFNMDKKMLPYVYDQVTFIYKNLHHPDWYGTSNKGFYQWEADKFKRIYELAMNTDDDREDIRINRRDLVKFVDEHDVRRGTNFLDTFPEMAEFYHAWKATIV